MTYWWVATTAHTDLGALPDSKDFERNTPGVLIKLSLSCLSIW